MITMTEDEFTNCMQQYEDKGYWPGLKHGFAAGMVATALVVTPLVMFAVSMGLYVGIQQEMKK